MTSTKKWLISSAISAVTAGLSLLLMLLIADIAYIMYVTLLISGVWGIISLICTAVTFILRNKKEHPTLIYKVILVADFLVAIPFVIEVINDLSHPDVLFAGISTGLVLMFFLPLWAIILIADIILWIIKKRKMS